MTRVPARAVRLRAVADADLPALFEHQHDPEASAMAHFPPREREAFMDHWRTRVLGKATTLARTIEVDGAVAGYVASWVPEQGGREVGYWLGRAFWGRGIASAALAAFLAEEEPRRPLSALVAVHNAASRRVLERCGFVAVGAPTSAADGVMEQAFELVAR